MFKVKSIQEVGFPNSCSYFFSNSELQLTTEACYPIQILCIYLHFVYKNCARCTQLMQTKCIQDVYKMYRTFRQTFVDIHCAYKILKELLQLNLYVGYILYTFCIHQFWSTKSAHHKNYVYNLYTNSNRMYTGYTNNCSYAKCITHFNVFWPVCCTLPKFIIICWLSTWR